MDDDLAAPDPSLDGFEFPMPPGFEEMNAMSQQRYKRPDWESPPFNWLPGFVALEHVAGRSDEAVVQLTGLRAYPIGFSLDVRSIVREPDYTLDHAMFGGPGMHGPGSGGALPDAMLRVALAFADGSTVSSLGMFTPPPMPPSADNSPTGPVMMMHGGGGGGGEYSHQYWCWPLPPEGPVRVICEWPALGIQREVTEFDSALIRDAASRAEQVWDDPPEPPTGADGVSVQIW